MVPRGGGRSGRKRENLQPASHGGAFEPSFRNFGEQTGVIQQEFGENREQENNFNPHASLGSSGVGFHNVHLPPPLGVEAPLQSFGGEFQVAGAGIGAARVEVQDGGLRSQARSRSGKERCGDEQLGFLVSSQGGRSNPKGKNFNEEEERQLTQSVLAISQDPICGNQQKRNTFWQRIFEHYNDKRPGDYRPARSLESKWGIIKHDVTRFCGVYKHVVGLNPSGTSAADLLRMAKELYNTKSAKSAEFIYEHCWLIVKDFPKWAAGWSAVKSPSPSRMKSQSSTQQSKARTIETSQLIQENVGALENEIFKERPLGTKATKEIQRESKTKEVLSHAQVKATIDLTAVTREKNKILEDQNMLLLMTTPTAQILAPAAQEYLRLRQEEELGKLHLRLESDRLAKAKLTAEIAALEKAQLESERVRASEEQYMRDETMHQLEEQHVHRQYTPDSNESHIMTHNYTHDGWEGEGAGNDDKIQFNSNVTTPAFMRGAFAGCNLTSPPRSIGFNVTSQQRSREASPMFNNIGNFEEQHRQKRMRSGSKDGVEVGQASNTFNFALDIGRGRNLNSQVGFDQASTYGVNRGAFWQGVVDNQHDAIHLDDSSHSEWDTMDRVDPTMPSTWHVLGVQGGESENGQASTSVDIDLSLNGRQY